MKLEDEIKEFMHVYKIGKRGCLTCKYLSRCLRLGNSSCEKSYFTTIDHVMNYMNARSALQDDLSGKNYLRSLAPLRDAREIFENVVKILVALCRLSVATIRAIIATIRRKISIFFTKMIADYPVMSNLERRWLNGYLDK